MYFFALSETSTEISLTSIITHGSPHLCHPGLLGGSARRQQPPALSKPLRCHLTTWVGSKQPLGTAEAHSSFLGPCSSPPAFGTDSLTAATLQTGRNMPGGTKERQAVQTDQPATALEVQWGKTHQKKKKKKPLNWILFEWIYIGGTNGKPTPRGVLSIIWWSTPMEKAAGGGISLIVSVIHSPSISDSSPEIFSYSQP